MSITLWFMPGFTDEEPGFTDREAQRHGTGVRSHQSVALIQLLAPDALPSPSSSCFAPRRLNFRPPRTPGPRQGPPRGKGTAGLCKGRWRQRFEKAHRHDCRIRRKVGLTEGAPVFSGRGETAAQPKPRARTRAWTSPRPQPLLPTPTVPRDALSETASGSPPLISLLKT